MEEIWKDVKGFEGKYQVSNFGNARSVDHIMRRDYKSGRFDYCKHVGRILKQGTSGYGYNVFFTRDKNGRNKSFYLHKYIALAFIGDIPKGYVVNHIDGIKTNNKVENLEIITKSDDGKHAYRIGLRKPSKVMGSAHPFSKLKENDVIEIKKMLDTVKCFDIANKFNVSKSLIFAIKFNRTWKHIP